MMWWLIFVNVLALFCGCGFSLVKMWWPIFEDMLAHWLKLMCWLMVKMWLLTSWGYVVVICGRCDGSLIGMLETRKKRNCVIAFTNPTAHCAQCTCRLCITNCGVGEEPALCHQLPDLLPGRGRPPRRDDCHAFQRHLWRSAWYTCTLCTVYSKVVELEDNQDKSSRACCPVSGVCTGMPIFGLYMYAFCMSMSISVECISMSICGVCMYDYVKLWSM